LLVCGAAAGAACEEAAAESGGADGVLLFGSGAADCAEAEFAKHVTITTIARLATRTEHS